MTQKRIYMEQQFKCVVFDLDGTLLDTSSGLMSAIRYTIDKFGLEPLSEDTMKSLIGPPMQKSFKRVYGFEDDVITEMADVFRNRYKDVELLLATPYDGIYKVFEYLNEAGIIPAIATYKREDYALKLLKHYDFDRYTKYMYGSDMDGRLKKKDIIELSLNAAGVSDYSQALMVGDSDNDATGAAEIGAKFLGVTYGFGFKKREDIFQFDAIGTADTPEGIIDIISGRN